MRTMSFGSVQPREFAEPQALYDLAGTVGRCICQDTIKVKGGEWVHGNGDVWCR